MKNFKHSLIAVIAVAMISSLAVAQASGLNNSKTEREQRINAAAAEQSITIAQRILQTQLKVLPRFQQNLQRLLLKIQQKKAKSRQRVFTLLAMYLSQTVHLT